MLQNYSKLCAKHIQKYRQRTILLKIVKWNIFFKNRMRDDGKTINFV